MMKSQEILQIQLVEEMAETILSLCKSLRFGLEDGYPNSDTTNAEDIAQEFNEAVAIFSMLENTENFVCLPTNVVINIQEEKIAKANHWLDYSKEKGILTDE